MSGPDETPSAPPVAGFLFPNRVWGGFALSQLGPKVPFVGGCLLLTIALVLLWRLAQSGSSQALPRVPQEN